jgi:hypothetical protein
MAKWTNNDLQNIAQKTKDRATRTPLKTVGELRCSATADSSNVNFKKDQKTLTTVIKWIKGPALGKLLCKPQVNSGKSCGLKIRKTMINIYF